jgi:excisionase family DNA binding protein
MATIDRERLLPPKLTAEEADLARAAQRLIMESLDHSHAAHITLTSGAGASPTVSMPPAVLGFIARALGLLASGRAVVLMPQKQELSTVEAANVLDVSRPFVIKEIEAGRLKHRKVGSHRRVLYEDLIDYARIMRAEQRAALDRMADNARELGLEYRAARPRASRWPAIRATPPFSTPVCSTRSRSVTR